MSLSNSIWTNNVKVMFCTYIPPMDRLKHSIHTATTAFKNGNAIKSVRPDLFFWAFGDGGGASSWSPYSTNSIQSSYSPLFLDKTTVTAGKHMEAIREGVEDYEYFSLLRDAIEKATSAGRFDDVVDRAKSLLTNAQNEVLSAPWRKQDMLGFDKGSHQSRQDASQNTGIAVGVDCCGKCQELELRMMMHERARSIMKSVGLCAIVCVVVLASVGYGEENASRARTVRVCAVCQSWEGKDRNLRHVLKMLDQAASERAEIVCLPGTVRSNRWRLGRLSGPGCHRHNRRQVFYVRCCKFERKRR